MTQLFAELDSPGLTGPSAYGMAVTSHAITNISGCSYSTSAQRFVCPDTTVDGLKFTKSFTLNDGSGALQSQFNPTTTGAIRIQATLAGPLSPGGRLVTNATQLLELGGLRTGTHVVNGLSRAIVTGVTDAATGQPVTHNFTTSVQDLVLPKFSATPGPPAWPTSGHISAIDSVSVQGALTSVSNFDARFSGTSRVTVAIIQGNSTKYCIMDLASQPLVCL